jgi:transcriptional regulator with XRE-family HTH domain
MQASSPTVRRWQLANRLRNLRASTGLSIEQVATQMLASPSKISRIETGVRPPTPRDLRDLGQIYGTSADTVRELTEMLRESKQRAWWQNFNEVASRSSTYLDLEDAATGISWYETIRIPGLLQTADYTRASIQAVIPSLGSDAVDQYVESRAARQHLLNAKPPLSLWVILDESAVRRQVGGPKVMSEQVHRLIEIATDLPNVTLQLLPFSAGGHAGMDGSFSILRFPAGSLSDVVYIENRTGHLFLNRDEDIEVFREVLNYLRATASSPEESISLLQDIASNLQLT